MCRFPAPQSSTVQILGAEKALFRALKTRGHTPKYGLIFHSSFIGRAKVRPGGGSHALQRGNSFNLQRRLPLGCASAGPQCSYACRRVSMHADVNVWVAFVVTHGFRSVSGAPAWTCWTG